MRFPFFGRGRGATAMAAPAVEAKASRTAALIAFEQHGRAAWTPRDYAALAREGFMKNAVVYRSVRMIAEAAASVPWLLYEGDAERRPASAARPARAAEPAPVAASLSSRRWYGHLLVRRQRLCRGGRDGGRGARAARAPARPDEGGARHATAGRRATSTPSAGARCAFRPARAGVAPILHLCAVPPARRPLRLRADRSGGDGARHPQCGGRWNKALLDNSARPSGALVYAAEGRRQSPTSSSSG